ncbi:unnamed protein product [Urochloa humidicola]
MPCPSLITSSFGDRRLCSPPCLLLLLLVLGTSTRWCAAETHRNVITHIKGFDGPLPFHLETGYVEVDEEHGVRLFYYFIESERKPAEDPLILWITGGPGCSALSGLLFEIGIYCILPMFP